MLLAHKIASICYRRGLRRAIICPGSRNAPLTLSFTGHGGFALYSVSDERSAAYMALGMSLHDGEPTILVCTSGTAALNFAPALAEAYYLKVPLLVLTADRPPEWLDQGDGQTIHQRGIFSNFVKKTFDFPSQDSHADVENMAQRLVNEAVSTCCRLPAGPVHINVPLREPLYPAGNAQVNAVPVRVIQEFAPKHELSAKDWVSLALLLDDCPKKLLVIGNYAFNADFRQKVSSFTAAGHIPAVVDFTSNLGSCPQAITLNDRFLPLLTPEQAEALMPDLIISAGGDHLSKNLKKFLRNAQPKVHLRVGVEESAPDIFMNMTHRVTMDPGTFLTELSNRMPVAGSPEYLRRWMELEEAAKQYTGEFWDDESHFGEQYAVRALLRSLAPGTDLHLANSMSVRYAAYAGQWDSGQVRIHGNRGTGGIDGCTSTAIGCAAVSGRPTLLLTGDMAFFYDRNAFWNLYVPDNFAVAVINNHGGSIFKMIDGPAERPEAEEFFVTRQPLTARSLAQEYGFAYFYANNCEDFRLSLERFLKTPGKKIIEIETASGLNTQLLTKFRKGLKF